MATYNVELRRKGATNFTDGDLFLVHTAWELIDNKPSTYTPTAHTHSNYLPIPSSPYYNPVNGNILMYNDTYGWCTYAITSAGIMPYYAGIADMSASTGTITSSHINNVLTSSYAGAQTLTLTAGLGIGSQITIVRTSSNASAVTISRSSTETINGATSVNFSGQYKAITLIKITSTAWIKVGA